MDYTVALGVWAVTVTAPCVVSWLAGDMVGSARTRRLYAEGGEGLTPTSEIESAYGVEEWRLGVSAQSGDRATGHDQPLSERRLARRHSARFAVADDALSFEEQAREAERRRLRREAFATMPALAELRAHAETIRRNDSPLAREDWDVAGEVSTTDRVLRHYENSVLELQRSKSGLSASRSTSALGENGAGDRARDRAHDRAQGLGSRVARAG